MNCDEALLAISAALDGELSPAERAKLSNHLLECPQCRGLAEDLRVLTDALEESDLEPPESLPASIRRAVAEEVKQSAQPKQRKAPYLRTIAAMLALCVCLGGVSLFVSGNKKAAGNSADSGAGAPAPFQARPEALEKSSDGFAGSTDEAGDYNGAAEGEDAPMESTASMEQAAPEEPAAMPSSDYGAPAPAPADSAAPAPSPSSAPIPAEVTGGANGDTAVDAPDGGSDSIGSKAAVTPEEALELAFEYLGGYEEYPDAQLRVDDFGGYDAPVYYLKTVEANTGTWEYRLDYDRMFDGENYWFHLYYLLVAGELNGGHTATINWIKVSVDGGVVTPMY